MGESVIMNQTVIEAHRGTRVAGPGGVMYNTEWAERGTIKAKESCSSMEKPLNQLGMW